VKDDLPPLPDRVPAKRRALHDVPDVHIAMWLAGELTGSERRRLSDEKARRKAAVPDHPVGLLVGREGITPAQQSTIVELLGSLSATEVHHPGVSSSLHQACRRVGVPVVVQDGLREVVKASAVVVGAPKERSRPVTKSTVWDMILYAKHRSLVVKVVLPDGLISTGPDA
jgi:hypothetical protein